MDPRDPITHHGPEYSGMLFNQWTTSATPSFAAIPGPSEPPRSPFKIDLGIKPHVNFTSGEITLDTFADTTGRLLMRQMMATKELAIRQALIALGWTPPPDGTESRATLPPKTVTAIQHRTTGHFLALDSTRGFHFIKNPSLALHFNQTQFDFPPPAPHTLLITYPDAELVCQNTHLVRLTLTTLHHSVPYAGQGSTPPPSGKPL